MTVYVIISTWKHEEDTTPQSLLTDCTISFDNAMKTYDREVKAILGTYWKDKSHEIVNTENSTYIYDEKGNFDLITFDFRNGRL